MKNSLLITIILLIVVGGAAFYGGMKYQQSQTRAGFGQFAQGNAGAGFQRNGSGTRGGNFGGATSGDIVSMDANSITVKLQDGSSKIVNLSDSTTYSKTDSASKADLKTGIKVAAFGTTNSDGSITAQNVQLNPTSRIGQRPSGIPPNPSQ